MNICGIANARAQQNDCFGDIGSKDAIIGNPKAGYCGQLATTSASGSFQAGSTPASRHESKKKETVITVTENKTYNGWTNYETWNVKLWMDNDEGSYRYWQETAEESWKDSASYTPSYEGQTRKEFWLCQFSDHLKQSFENDSQDILERAGVESSMWSDLLGAALSEVNWYEIAESFANDLEE